MSDPMPPTFPSTSPTPDALKPGIYQREADGIWPGTPVPTPDEILAGLATIRAVHPPTPFIASVPLSNRHGVDILLKLEGTSGVRSFKFRGALTAVAAIAAERPGSSVVTASTGNHGQGVAFAGARHGIDVTIVSPVDSLREKLVAMRALGANVVVYGANLTEAEVEAKAIAQRLGGVYLEDGESPYLMTGAASIVLEMIEADPTLDTIVVPVGGGNLVAATLLGVQAAHANASVVGVQSIAAPGATMSWLAGKVIRHQCTTYAGGLATERPGSLSLTVMTNMLETMVLVTEDDLRRATADAFRSLGLVMEGAAAAPLAALTLHRDFFTGKRIGLLVSGSWLGPDQLREALAL